MMEPKDRFVFVVKVKTRHVYADLFQNIRNMLGMNLISYENLITETINEARDELFAKYPDIDPYTVKIDTTQLTTGAAEVIVSGIRKTEHASGQSSIEV